MIKNEGKLHIKYYFGDVELCEKCFVALCDQHKQSPEPDAMEARDLTDHMIRSLDHLKTGIARLATNTKGEVVGVIPAEKHEPKR